MPAMKALEHKANEKLEKQRLALPIKNTTKQGKK
jgi:hypothetical protein